MLLKMSSKGLLHGDRCVCWCAIRGYYMDLVTSFSLEDLLSFASVALLALSGLLLTPIKFYTQG